MAEHNVTFELYYDGSWHQAPVLTRDGVRYMRGTKTPGNDTEPANGSLTLDNTSELYAPRSVKSALYGKIGQNTKGRLSADGDIRMSGEVASWKPQRPIKGSGWTPVQLAGVLRRIGRGHDPLLPALTRCAAALGPVDYWPLDDGRNATEGANIVQGGAAMANVAGRPAVAWSGVDETLVPDGMSAMVSMNGGALTAPVRGTSSASWRLEALYGIQANSLGVSDVVRGLTWTTGGGINTWWIEHGYDYTIVYGRSYYAPGLIFGHVLLGSGDARFQTGVVQHVAVDVQQVNSTDMSWQLTLNGVVLHFGTDGTGSTVGRPQVGPPSQITLNPDGDARVFGFGGVGFWGPSPVSPATATAARGYVGETAADRFSRLCAEEDIAATVVGTASDSAPMGAQGTNTLLDLLDEIARTDDASIFETRDNVGLTMRTGASKLNQTAVLTLNYAGQVRPPLVPVFGDEGIRNDATARNPNGSTGRVQQLTGPHNVQLPEDDPQGVGRYQTSLDVNTSTDAALSGVAGWRVNLGTYNGTWYAEVTADLDAAPGLTSAVNAVDIGDVVAIANLPADEALETVEGLVIGIEESLPPKRRLVTFYLVPADPYRVGKLSATSGDTDPVVGRAAETTETSSTTVDALAAGATSFYVATSSGPLWTTDSDDFPLDVIVGGQRVTVSGITSAVSDTYTRSVASGSWGTADSGQVWSGSNSLWSVTGSAGRATHAGSGGAFNILSGTSGFATMTAQVRISIGQKLTGSGSMFPSLLLRILDSSNFYQFGVFYSASGTPTGPVGVVMGKVVGGSFISLYSNFSFDVYNGSESFWLKVAAVGSFLAIKVWRATATEPAAWTATATDTTFSAGSFAAYSSRDATTDVNPFVEFDDLTVVNPQTFTVAPAGKQVRYPIAAGAAVKVQQPLILTV